MARPPITGPSPTGSSSADPLTTDPLTTDPLTTDPLTTDPLTTDPLTTDPLTTDPLTTDPLTTDPLTTDPDTTDTEDADTTDEPNAGRRHGRARRSGRARRTSEHLGDRCTMCGRRVVVDARGRCPLGHQVLQVREVEQRAVDRGEVPESARDDAAARAADPEAAGRVVATYVEPRTADPAAAPADAAHAVSMPVQAATTPRPPESAPTQAAPLTEANQAAPSAVRTPVFEDPPPPLPLPGSDNPAASAAPGLPVRVRGRLVEPAARNLFSEALERGPEPNLDPPALPRRASPGRVAGDPSPSPVAGDPGPGDGRAVVSRADLTPDAPSALDLVDDGWSHTAIPADTVYEQEPGGEFEAPRGIAQLIAGGIFVAILRVIAWYLATSL